MNAIKKLLWVDFVLSLTAAIYFVDPGASAATYGLCTDPVPSLACQLALLNMQLFYGKSLAHSACILAAALSREPRTVALITSGVFLWCITMATLLWTSPFASRMNVGAGAVTIFGVLYAVLLTRLRCDPCPAASSAPAPPTAETRAEKPVVRNPC
jgi:hypothetical protein